MGAEEVLRWRLLQQQQSGDKSSGGKNKKSEEGRRGGYEDVLEDEEDDWSEDETEEGKKFIRCVQRFIFHVMQSVILSSSHTFCKQPNPIPIHKQNIDIYNKTTIPEFDHICSLERAAYTTLYLLQQLHSSSADVSAMTTTPKKRATQSDGDDNDGSNNNNNIATNGSNNLPSLSDFSSNDNSSLNGVVLEKSRFLAKLAPRIRRLESDTAKCLVSTLEELLVRVRTLMEDDHDANEEGQGGSDNTTVYDNNKQQRKSQHDDLLLMIGHCLRGLALLGKGADAESAFARVAIMPIIRSKLSMGKLDEGGSR
eukprot:scaffold13638_cov77-Skeletonema_marinoi.AAC.1